jgi:hypothetical protein
MMSEASAKYLLATEVYDIASAQIVGAAHMLAKLAFIEIAQDRNFPACVGPRDFRQLIQCEAQDAYAGPAATGAGQYLPSVLASSPMDRYVLAMVAGPQRDALDCQLTFLSNVAATGSRHARSISSGVRVTEDSMTCVGTCHWGITRAPALRRTAATKMLVIR